MQYTCYAEGLSIHQLGDAATVFRIMGFQLIGQRNNTESKIRFSLQQIERRYYNILFVLQKKQYFI